MYFILSLDKGVVFGLDSKPAGSMEVEGVAPDFRFGLEPGQYWHLTKERLHPMHHVPEVNFNDLPIHSFWKEEETNLLAGKLYPAMRQEFWMRRGKS